MTKEEIIDHYSQDSFEQMFPKDKQIQYQQFRVYDTIEKEWRSDHEWALTENGWLVIHTWESLTTVFPHGKYVLQFSDGTWMRY